MKQIYLLLILITFSFNTFSKSFIPKRFKINFKQTTTSQISGKEKNSWGTLDYKHPGYIKFEFHKPNKILFISNPQKTWYYTPSYDKNKKGNVTISKTKPTGPSSFFDILKYGFINNKFYKATIYKNKTASILFETQTAKRLAIKDAFFTFNNNKKNTFDSISSIKINYTEKPSVLLTFNEIKINLKFSKKHFIYKGD